MARLKFKKKCNVCKDSWVLVRHREYTICVDCHMKQIFEQDVTDKKYSFLNIDKDLYEQSRFLRNIRKAYLNAQELTERQVAAFKEVVQKVQAGDIDEE